MTRMPISPGEAVFIEFRLRGTLWRTTVTRAPRMPSLSDTWVASVAWDVERRKAEPLMISVAPMESLVRIEREGRSPECAPLTAVMDLPPIRGPYPVGAWQPMAYAPHNANWLSVAVLDGNKVRVERLHWAQDESGDDQPPYRGWFKEQPIGDGFIQAAGVMLGWRPIHAAEAEL
jgi:hypothetical protein